MALTAAKPIEFVVLKIIKINIASFGKVRILFVFETFNEYIDKVPVGLFWKTFVILILIYN